MEHPPASTLVGVATAFAYVGLFAQAFSLMAHTVDLAGQVAVLYDGTAVVGSGTVLSNTVLAGGDD